MLKVFCLYQQQMQRNADSTDTGINCGEKGRGYGKKQRVGAIKQKGSPTPAAMTRKTDPPPRKCTGGVISSTRQKASDLVKANIAGYYAY